jgi:hypothetical protein
MTLEQSLATGYRALFAAFQAGPPVPKYPLSMQRRPEVIAEIASKFKHCRGMTAVDVRVWWNHPGATTKTANPEKTLCDIGIEQGRPSYPTEDEWTSALAATMVGCVMAPSREEAELKIAIVDYVDQWRRIQKAKKIDSFLASLTLVGWVSNIISALTPAETPEPDTIQWKIWRMACAQVEALTVLKQVEGTPSPVPTVASEAKPAEIASEASQDPLVPAAPTESDSVAPMAPSADSAEKHRLPALLYGLVGGLVMAVLPSIPNVSLLLLNPVISDAMLEAVMTDLFLHFIANWVIWGGVIAALVVVYRKLRKA